MCVEYSSLFCHSLLWAVSGPTSLRLSHGISGPPCTLVVRRRRTQEEQAGRPSSLVYAYDCPTGSIRLAEGHIVDAVDHICNEKNRGPDRYVALTAETSEFHRCVVTTGGRIANSLVPKYRRPA